MPFLCLSEVLKILDLQQAATETRRSAYAYEVKTILCLNFVGVSIVALSETGHENKVV